MEEKLLSALINAGVGGLIASLIVYLTYRLVSRVLFNLGDEMVRAFREQADAISRQALSVDGLTKSIQDFIKRDDSEHREMLVLLKYIAQNQQELIRVRNEHDECPHCQEGSVSGGINEVNQS